MKKVILLTVVLLAFFGISWAEDTSKIIEEKINLIIEFPLPEKSDSRDFTAKTICEETANLISEQREGIYVKDLKAAIIDIDETRGMAKLSCSFELKYGESCDCPPKDCGDYWINGCAANCSEGQQANCDCGSCSGIGTSSCRCW